MDERSYLHDQEQLLLSMRPSTVELIWSLLRGIVNAVVIWAISSVLFLSAWWFSFGAFPSAWWFVLLAILSEALVWWLRYRLWKRALFRATTERILLQYSGTLFNKPLKTIKWPQYQEAYTKKGNPLDLFFRTKSVCVRYGTAQGELTSCFPSVRYAVDIKHYLDKVDSAIRAGQASTLRPFVAKPRGKRDE